MSPRVSSDPWERQQARRLITDVAQADPTHWDEPGGVKMVQRGHDTVVLEWTCRVELDGPGRLRLADLLAEKRP